jgi:hypothetical protein
MRAPLSERPLSAIVVVVVCLLAALASCGGPAADGDSGAGQAPREDTAESVVPESLRALGYVEWDPEANTELRGVTRWEPARAAPGYNFYSDQAGGAILARLDGEQIHSWRLPSGERACELAELLPDGDVILVCQDESLTRLDWNSHSVWDLEIRAHHDVEVAADGTLLVVDRDLYPYQGRQVWFDGIAWVSGEGQVLRRWSTFEHLAELRRHHPPSPLDRPASAAESRRPEASGNEAHGDYYHVNAVEILPDTPLGKRDARFRGGNLLVCLRNANLLLILDAKTLSVTWSWGPGQLQLPHMPTMLDDGNILVFDNGVWRRASRVLEIEPASGEIVWTYGEEAQQRFFVKERGCSQRLANGNTLICDSQRGHVFEVASSGETVWEFWNPEFQGKSRRRLYRFERLPASRVEPLLRAHGVARESTPGR